MNTEPVEGSYYWVRSYGGSWLVAQFLCSPERGRYWATTFGWFGFGLTDKWQPVTPPAEEQA